MERGDECGRVKRGDECERVERGDECGRVERGDECGRVERDEFRRECSLYSPDKLYLSDQSHFALCSSGFRFVCVLPANLPKFTWNVELQ